MSPRGQKLLSAELSRESYSQVSFREVNVHIIYTQTHSNTQYLGQVKD